MIKLKRGIFESVASGFAGVVNFLISYTSGKFHAATSDGASYSEIDPLVFGTSNINDIEYAPDLTTGSSTSTITGFTPNPPTWTTRTVNMNNGLSISYGNGLFILLAYNANGTTNIRTSTDAITWVSRSANTAYPGSTDNWYNVAYGNGIWLISGSYSNTVQRSTDGITWTTQNTTIPSQFTLRFPIKYGNGQWLISTSDALVRSSTDAISWVTRSIPPSTVARLGISYGNNLWVISDGTNIFTGTDLITWTTRSLNFTDIEEIAYGNGLWVGIANNNISTSTDTVTWVSRDPKSPGNLFLRSIIFDNSLWIAQGWYGRRRISTDAINWVTDNQPNLSFGYSSDTFRFAYGNGLWANLMVNILVTSPINPTLSTTYSYSGNTTVAVANDGKAARSTNGISWTTINTGATTNLTAISFVTTSATTQAYFIGGI